MYRNEYDLYKWNKNIAHNKLIYRITNKDKNYFLYIFTWRSASLFNFLKWNVKFFITSVKIPGKATPVKIPMSFHWEKKTPNPRLTTFHFFQDSALFRFTFYRLGFLTSPEEKKKNNLKNTSVLPSTNWASMYEWAALSTGASRFLITEPVETSWNKWRRELNNCKLEGYLRQKEA